VEPGAEQIFEVLGGEGGDAIVPFGPVGEPSPRQFRNPPQEIPLLGAQVVDHDAILLIGALSKDGRNAADS
jgi:hypothetical protein